MEDSVKGHQNLAKQRNPLSFHTGNCVFRAGMPEFRWNRKQHNIPVHKIMEDFYV